MLLQHALYNTPHGDVLQRILLSTELAGYLQTERLPPKGGRFKTSGGLNRRLKAMLLKAGGFYHFRLRRLKNFSDNKLMKKTFFISVVVYILLAACNAQSNIPTTFPSLTPETSFTATAIAISTLTSTPTRIQPTEPPSTPTFTPFPPYHNKKVIFEYYTSGQLSYFDMFYADYRDLPNIILYADGQMLVGGGQKVLSADEIKSFLSKLDDLGFFSIESNQKHDQEDKLYAYPDHYDQFIDASSTFGHKWDFGIG
jgi:hypothetical protein